MIDYDLEVATVVREALAALQQSNPEIAAKLDAVIEGHLGRPPSHAAIDANLHHVEAAFRNEGKALMPTDGAAARTLFGAAESLGEIAAYQGLPRDS